METMKSEAKGVEKQANKISQRWKRANSCERCSQEVPIMTDSVLSLCGVVHSRLCMLCCRDWDTDPKVTELMTEMNAARFRAEAFAHAGNADGAEASYRDSEQHRDHVRAYAIAWLSTKIQREDVHEED